MKTPVVILGYNGVGRLLASAIQRQPDLRVAMVCECDERRLSEAHQRGWPVCEVPEGEANEEGSWWADCRRWTEPEGGITVSPAGAPEGATVAGFSLLTPAVFAAQGRAIRVSSANALAYARLFRALTPVGSLDRCQATIVERRSHDQQGSIDALKPLFDRSEEVEEMKSAFAQAVDDFHLCRVSVPYTRSHLHLARLEFHAEVPEAEVKLALGAAPRIVLGAAHDGFLGTAQVQEFCRDGARPEGARPELFIWSDSVVVARNRVHLAMDVEPDATPIPEVIDAIRLSAQEGVTFEESIATTDRALGLKLDFDWVRSRRITVSEGVPGAGAVSGVR
jgi:glyceraldehyde-3-phosphate dehydrogenase/erythrose-4-phosphate dehydrogenase